MVMDPNEERKKLSSRLVEINKKLDLLQKRMDEITDEIAGGAMNIQQLNDEFDGLMDKYDTLDIERKGIANRLKELAPKPLRF